MVDQSSGYDSDLAPFLCARGDPEEGEALAVLMAAAQPLIRRILRAKLDRHSSSADVDDVAGSVAVRLLRRLRRLKEGKGKAILDFERYVATMTYRAHHDYLRATYPQWHRLKTRVRYLLLNHPGFALWEEAEGPWLCGFATWVPVGMSRSSSVRPRQATTGVAAGGRSRETRDLVEHVTSAFDDAGHPISFDGLVRRLVPLSLSASDWDAHLLGLPRAAGDRVSRPDDRIFLRQLCAAIGTLPLNMRRVLVLGLRGSGGHDVIGLLPATGVATLPDIARLLEMPISAVRALWWELPLDDRTLAAHLNATRQQVANMRASARRHLALRVGYDAARTRS